MNWAAFIDPTVSGRVCLALLHSLWQVGTLAIIAWGLDRLPKRLSVERSYVFNVALLVASLAALPATYWFLESDAPAAAAPHQAVVAAAPPTSSAVASGFTERSSPTDDASRPKLLGGDGDSLNLVTANSATTNSATAITAQPSDVWSRFAPWILTVYAAGVLLMIARLAAGIWHAHLFARQAERITEGPLFDRMTSLARRWSMRAAPALGRADRILVPKVVGLARPMILLPVATLTGLSPDELDLVIAHELAHVRRYDMWVNLLQRLGEAMLFFNPALWYLSRRVSALREYCCDELACQAVPPASSDPQILYATALVHVAEMSAQALAHHGRGRKVRPADIAALAASGRTPSELRRRIARLFGEPVPEPVRLSRGALATLALLVATITLGPPAWNTVAAQAEKESADQAATEDEQPKAPTFDLLVVDPDGKPVRQITVEFRIDPTPTAAQITHGTFISRSRYNALAKTADDGRVILTLPKTPKNFSASVQQPGFGPYWAKWNAQEHPEAIPAKFTAELEAAWSVGGALVDEQGAPVAGAEVKPWIETKKRPGDTRQLGAGARIKTDVDGKWQFDSVPNSLSEVRVEISHEDFKPIRRALTRSEFGIEKGKGPATTIALDRGLTVAGKITDESGQPIAGAVVRAKFLNDIRKATTGDDGTYRLVGCEPSVVRVVVSAKGRAVDMKEVRVDPDMDPVDFELRPGGKLRVRVLDAQGAPAPKARIFFQRWRGRFQYFEFDDVNQYANQDGVWEWNEAPLDEIQVDVCPIGGMQMLLQPLTPRDEEYVFHTSPVLVITGKVTDAETGKPVTSFRAVPGMVALDGHISWARHDGYQTTDGRYELHRNRGEPAHLVNIEADGYEVATSREIKSDEGAVTIDFELKKGKDVAALVTTPQGKPAVGAKVAVGIPGSQINITGGDIDDGGTYAARKDTDDAGRFSFPAQNTPCQVVITHPAGYAYLTTADSPIPPAIQLTPWARVEGTFRVGKDPVAAATLTLNTNTVYSSGDAPHIYSFYEVTTGDKGQYAFERVFPGECHLGRRINYMVDEGATETTSAQMVAAQLVAGETTHLELGGTGRPVIGRLIPPAGYDKKVQWSFAFLSVQVELPPLPPNPSPADRAFYKSLDSSRPYYDASVDPDGNFRIDDMLSTNYVLSVNFGPRRMVGRIAEHRFVVPEPQEGDDPRKPFDLGTLRLDE